MRFAQLAVWRKQEGGGQSLQRLKRYNQLIANQENGVIDFELIRKCANLIDRRFFKSNARISTFS